MATFRTWLSARVCSFAALAERSFCMRSSTSRIAAIRVNHCPSLEVVAAMVTVVTSESIRPFLWLCQAVPTTRSDTGRRWLTPAGSLWSTGQAVKPGSGAPIVVRGGDRTV